MTDNEQLYKTYFGDVYRYVLRLSANERIAEEVTSDTFWRAMRGIDSFRGECEIRVWLCQIAKNVYLSYMKKNAKTDSIDESELYEIPDGAPNAEDSLLVREDVSKIQKILHGLGEPYKEVFLWRVYAELSFGEIGRMFGKTENWACVTYHRARKIIKQRMEDEDNG